MRIFMLCYEKRLPQLSYGAHVTSATSQAARRIARWLRLRSEIRFVLPFIGCEILLPSYSVAVKSSSPPYQRKGGDAVRLDVDMYVCYRYPLNLSMVHPKSEKLFLSVEVEGIEPSSKQLFLKLSTNFRLYNFAIIFLNRHSN